MWETFFLKNHTQNYYQGLFWKIKIEHIKSLICLFTVCHRTILKLSCRPLASTLYKAFLKKTKRVLELVSVPPELVSLPHFIPCMIFEEKYFSFYILLPVLPDQISLSDCLYFLRYWTICVLYLSVTQVVPGCDVINLKINLDLSNQKVFFLYNTDLHFANKHLHKYT